MSYNPGAGGGTVSDGDKGDITVSGGVWTIDSGVVTLAKQANMATASVVYRKSAGSGAPEVQALATLKTDLGLTGTNSGDQTITLSGDVSGSGTGAITTAIGAGKVTLAMQANMATASVVYRKTAGSGAPEVQTLATLKTDLGLTGTNSGDQDLSSYVVNTRSISTTAPLTGGGDLSANRTLAISAATTAAAGSMSAEDKSRLDASFTRYHSLLDCSGSHTAARVAGTYGFGQGDPVAISGTGTLYPLNTIYIASADYPVAGTLNPKLRLRVSLYVNDVAPTGNFTFGLHPITRPATSGGAGLAIYTIGAAVASSTVAINTPAADSSNVAVTSDFALPADGHYVLGVVTTATVAASSHLHMSALLQMRYA